MTLPRTAAEVLSGHVRLEVRCIDRVLLTFRQPRLQYGQGIHGFFCHHRGNQFVSSALMRPMTERFAADIRHYIDTRRLDLVRFARGQSKDQVAKGYLAGKSGGDQILFARRGPGEDPGVADRAAQGRGNRKAVPVALPGPGDGRPLVLLRVPAPTSARSTSSSAATSRTPGRSTTAGTSTPSASA